MFINFCKTRKFISTNIKKSKQFNILKTFKKSNSRDAEKKFLFLVFSLVSRSI